MVSIGVPIHWAATAPRIPVFRIAASPPSNAAAHASRVSRSVPSMSNSTARTGRMSGLLLPEPPDFVPDMVDRLDRLSFLLPRHRRPVHPSPADGERSEVLLVPDPHDVTLPDRRIRVDYPGRHDVGAVVDEPDGAHVDRDHAFCAREREEAADRRHEALVEEERERLVVPQQEPVRARFRLVDRYVVRGQRHPELRREPRGPVGRFLAAEPGSPPNLQRGHRISGKRGRQITLLRRYLSLYVNQNQPVVATSDWRRIARAWEGSSRKAWSSILDARTSCPCARHASAASHQASASAGFRPKAASDAAIASFGRPRSKSSRPLRRYATSRPSVARRITVSQSASASSVRPSAAWRSARSRSGSASDPSTADSAANASSRRPSDCKARARSIEASGPPPSSTARRKRSTASEVRPRAYVARPAANHPRGSSGCFVRASSAGTSASAARRATRRRPANRASASTPAPRAAAAEYASIASSTRSRSSSSRPWWYHSSPFCGSSSRDSRKQWSPSS